jgi:hypothetical protein
MCRKFTTRRGNSGLVLSLDDVPAARPAPARAALVHGPKAGSLGTNVLRKHYYIKPIRNRLEGLLFSMHVR